MNKVLIIVGSLKMGGLERVAVNCVKYATKQSFDFLVFDTINGDLEDEARLFGKIFKKQLSSNPLSQFFYVYNFIRKHGPYDVVHSHLFFNSGLYMLAAFCCGVKIRIAHSHSIQRKETSLRKKCVYPLLRLLLQTFTTIPCACSCKAGMYLFGNFLFKKKGIIVPNIVDIDKFTFCEEERNRIRVELGINPNDVVIGQIGRLSSVKNQKMLLEIFSEYYSARHNFKLLLVGDGDLREDLESLAINLKIQNKLIMTGTRRDSHAILSAMDVFVCTSTNEGLGIVLLEAQANGLPCVVGKDSIVEEIKQLKNCELVVDYNNMKEWNEACDKAIRRGRNSDTVIQLRNSIFTEKKLKEVSDLLYASHDCI